MKTAVSFVLNGRPTEAEVEPWWSLLYLLREVLGLTGTKESCNMGECGACTVIVNGDAVASCLLPVLEVDGKEVQTIEGLTDAFNQELHPLQQAFVDEGAVQCGFCTPGVIMSAKALLDRDPDPSTGKIETAIEGNLCRCGGYPQIIKAIKAATHPLKKDHHE